MDNETKKNLGVSNSNPTKKRRIIGLGLISGGLDSLIATLLMKLQNIEVIGLNFKSPFCTCDKAYKNAECGLNLFYEKLGIKVYYLPKGDEYLEIIKNPKFGYGKNLNPCIDCRIFILKRAKEFAKSIKADFIFTGEVLDQRPKSQNLRALKIIERESGLEGILLRPLSALLLKPTKLEKEGLIDRSRLLGIRGRSRKIQLELARKHGLLNTYFACGGCLLTDKNFANRVRDYLKYNEKTSMKDMILLKYGRHFRYNGSKIIVGRNELENNTLIHIKNPEDIIMEAVDIKGPITIIQGKVNDDVLDFAAKLTIAYSNVTESSCAVRYGRSVDSLNQKIQVKKTDKKFAKKYLL